MTNKTIALVGAGPTAIYTLQSMLANASGPLSIAVLEQQACAGLGTPYRPGWNDPEMLANIASIELPPLGQSLVDWLACLPPDRKAEYGIDRAAIDDRAFYPRVVLGHYLRDRFEALVDEGRARGHTIDVRARSRIADIMVRNERFWLDVVTDHDERTQFPVDQLVIATGHEWPDEPEVRAGYFASPWPASALKRIEAGPVGIRGTSLSAIDATMALATHHGRFVERESEAPAPMQSAPLSDPPLHWIPNGSGARLAITMMSRKGLLPEADFFHPIPHEPLTMFTESALDTLIEQGAEGLLDRTFSLFKEQVRHSDPAYAARIGLEDLTLEAFSSAYFAQRLACDAFAWAQANLDEARRNFAARHVVQWRYTILCAHEVFARAIPHLDDGDHARFNACLRPVFTDNYATVPHASIERLLALHRAGALDILALGEDCRINSRTGERGAVVTCDGQTQHFPAFIDALGQRPLKADDFPFPSLLAQGIVVDAPAVERQRGIAIDAAFHPVSDNAAARRMYVLSLPFILWRHPFSQGLTSCYEMGEQVGRALTASGSATNGLGQADASCSILMKERSVRTPSNAHSEAGCVSTAGDGADTIGLDTGLSL